jgi:predicted Zn-dependent peptidase
MLTTLRALSLAAVAAAMPLALPAQEAMPTNPFAGFRTLTLPNGLRVWYGHLPGASATSMALMVPAGRDAAPHGKEQAAHLLEHVLLSDRSGGSEAELVRELALRGGSHGGFTTPVATVFPVTIPTENAAYAVHWLHDVVSPRVFGDHDVLRNRGPVALEISARPELPGVTTLRRILDPPVLRPAPFWRREFGLDASEERASAASSLFTITGRDLQEFYDRWYSPASMTLVVVSGAPPEALLPAINATFGTLPWRPVPSPSSDARPGTRETRRFVWSVRQNSSTLTIRYRLGDMSAVEDLRVAFMADMLRYRLMERLRRGDDKSVYATAVSTVSRGNVGLLSIDIDVEPGREAEVRQTVLREIDRLKNASTDPAFDADRDLLARRVRIDYASPGALLALAIDRFAAPGPHTAMPDLGAYYASVAPDSVAATAAIVLAAHNAAVTLSRPVPLPVPLLALLGLLPVAAAVALFRRLALVPADMRRIRYIARLRPHPATTAITVVLAGAVLLLAARLSVAGAQFVHGAWLAGIDSFSIHVAAAAIGIFGCTFLALAALGRLPRKVLVFDHEIRLKSPTFTATVIPSHGIADVTVGYPPTSSRLSRRGLPAVGQGVSIHLVGGTVLFLQVARPELLQQAVQPLLAHAARSALTEPVRTAAASVCS